MKEAEVEYQFFGEEWEQFVMTMPKKYIIDLYRKSLTGTKAKDICSIETLEDATEFLEKTVREYDSGEIDRPEMMEKLGEYTARCMHVFWVQAKKHIKEDPSLLDEE